MAVLSGQLARPTLGDIDNPQLTTDRSAFAWVDQFDPSPFVNATLRVGQTTLASHWPVEANGRAIAGQRQRAFVDDWYNRIHISPRQLDLGNVVSTQTTAVQLWNAYLAPQALMGIDGLGEGIELSGQPAPPLLFPALKELTWQVGVTPDGPSVLDTTLAWTFDNGDEAHLRITANRIVAWSFAPDWADGVLERLTWATDILQSESGVEQRRAIRLAPRREFEAPMLVEGRERQLLDLALFGWGSRVWAVPVWPDIQLLEQPVALGATRIDCATAGLDFAVGRLALLRGESAFVSEAVEVAAIDAGGIDLARPTQQAWPAGARLYPARSAQLLEQPSLTRLTDTAQSAQVRFRLVEPCDWPESLPATLYRGRPVFEQRPDESQDLTASFARLLAELDNGAAIPRVTDVAGRAFPVQGHRWLGMGRSERSALRSLLYALRGRQVPVWLPTHAADLEPVATVTAVATTLDVANVGYTRFGQSRPGRCDIRLELWDGTAFHRRITGSSELSADVERLSIDSPLGVQIEPAEVLRISWLTLCRLDSDSLEIHHETDSEGVANCALVFRGVRDDEF
ncbi:hypothetical protein [Azotobacter beijerinckii]|uniref:Uncharacterized protein n=1 Tax=Azotobacter beijerinckii TaxID=170623 RepID=A0A1I3ZM32_9GAMM|nr:hypothetical protein [Azotobacter beijerinckii]SFB48381.1 hypothetical protein SAMN04244571_03126 [Azotobacter beijerinckii]SFK45123.1 hypothetical protein SAMN04244574_00659 [Azotobacter beijerinckii]